MSYRQLLQIKETYTHKVSGMHKNLAIEIRNNHVKNRDDHAIYDQIIANLRTRLDEFSSNHFTMGTMFGAPLADYYLKSNLNEDVVFFFVSDPTGN